MLTIQSIDDQSPLLDAVKHLWRAHSATLGFMPSGAFADYARDQRVLVALNDAKCVGYLLYRVARDRVSIAHFCVASEARRQGIARSLLNHLVSITKRYRGIVLSCRRDFEASNTWPRLGFHASSERVGRAADGSELVRWILDYGHPDIFSVQQDSAVLDIAMDANVFLDLIERRNDETEGLRADWLRPFISLCYTPELLNDLNRSDDAEKRRKGKGEAQQFKLLSCSPEAYVSAEQILKPLFPTFDTLQDESDFRHLVRALAAAADAFVTRDEALLGRADQVFHACGLPVVRPAELIGRIDVIEHEREYQRNFVAGTRRIIQVRLHSVDGALISAIQATGEQKRKVAAVLHAGLADPQHVRTYKISDGDGGILAAFVVQQDADVVSVPLLRTARTRQAGSIVRSILTGLVRQAIESRASVVHVTDSSLPESTRAACADLGLLPIADGWLKLVPTGWLNIDDIPTHLKWSAPQIEQIKALLPGARTDHSLASRLEHLLWPAKLADAALPCFIVPIRPQFAEHLFDERLAKNSLFGADVDLALNPESAYYRAAKPSVVTCPSRILWYVKKSERYPNTMAIRACSRLVEVMIGPPKQLYSRFRRLGVYEWAHVLETAKGDLNQRIMAFRFDDSELLSPVPWTTFQEILKANGINTTLQSPVQIPASAFGAIYALALDSSPTR